MKELLVKDISLEQAKIGIDAALSKAEELNAKIVIAVVDFGGHLKKFARMDGARLASIDIAIRKARTARLFDKPTGEIGKMSQPGSPLYNIEHSNNGIISFGGGIPIKDAEGNTFGAVGVSGSTIDEDCLVAEAAIKAIFSN